MWLGDLWVADDKMYRVRGWGGEVGEGDMSISGGKNDKNDKCLLDCCDNCNS